MYTFPFILTLAWIIFVKYTSSYTNVRDLPFNAWEVYYNVYFGYGDNFNISNIFLVPGENETYEAEEPPKPLPTRRFNLYGDESMFDNRKALIDPDLDLMDANEFNEISKSILNVSKLKEDTRRMYESSLQLRRSPHYAWNCLTCWQRYEDNDDWPQTSISFERAKIRKTVNIILAFLTHARYKIKEALQVRDLLKLDKRYKLGYLFNRLRRLVYDQQKMYITAVQTERYWYYRNYTRSIYSYKVIMRYGVDVRDCIDWIKRVYYYEEDAIVITTPKSLDGKSKNKGS